MLADALEQIDGVTAAVHDLRAQQAGHDLVGLASDQPNRREAMILQYQGFAYGRWGWAPWLVNALRRMRSARPATTIVLLAHELFVELDGARQTVLGIGHRVQLAALMALSDIVLTTTEPFARRARPYARHPLGVLPVGSNLPDRRSTRVDTRRQLAVEEDQVVVALLGTGHWSRMFDLLAPTIDQLAQRRRLVVLNLGAGAPALSLARDDIVIHAPGELEAPRLAELLAAADLLLLPFIDGAATRRTTLIAGLQHAIPVLSTDGQNTDELLRSSRALDLVAVDRAPQTFARRAEMLLDDTQRRADLSTAGRELYDRCFAWPVLARQLVANINAPSPARERDRRSGSR